MRKHNLTAFRATSLTYSSPAVAATSPAPPCFYNAFPDLNDLAPDESRSAFPQKAKYLLSLDTMFFPTGIRVNNNSIDEDRLASLDPGVREAVDALIDKHGHQDISFSLPRTPELNQAYRMQSLFELAHKRLAASDYKWAFRTYHLASFYTTLENHLVRGKKIDVPLTCDDSHRASQLQRHWKTVYDGFKSTVLLNEAVSLLVCVILLPPKERHAHEEAWEREEEKEIKNSDFIDFYRKLRNKFNPESCTSTSDRRALAEQIIDYAKGELTRENVSLVDKVCLKGRKKNQRVSWPRLFGEEIHCGLPELRVRKDWVLGHATARISIPEAVQWFLALIAVLNDEERSFTRKDDAWPEYVMFSLDNGEDSAYPCITLEDSLELRMIVHLGVKKVDGSDIDLSQMRAPADARIADSICRYTLFLESIRQQICTGVGLCCPFWKGSGCCEFRPLLQRTYEVCNPWHPIWKCHWQRPPCLE